MTDTFIDRVRFAPLPPRAIGDGRLALSHLKVLAVVALHDGMSEHRTDGDGCWAAQGTMAKLCGINYTNFSTAINELLEWGYLYRRQHPRDGRFKVYRVIYDEVEAGTLTEKGLPTGKVPTEIVCPDGEIVCPENPQAIDIVKEAVPNILNKPNKQNKPSVGTAPPSGSAALEEDIDANVGAFLRRTEERLRADKILPTEFDELRSRLEDIAFEGDRDDPLTHWASRLGEKILTKQGFYD